MLLMSCISIYTYVFQPRSVSLPSALLIAFSLVIYPLAIEINWRMSAEHTYGVGFGLGWGASLFFLSAALCMSIDDVMRTLAKCCCSTDQDGATTKVWPVKESHWSTAVLCWCWIWVLFFFGGGGVQHCTLLPLFFIANIMTYFYSMVQSVFIY